MFPIDYPQFTTITALDWKNVLEDDREKDVIINSLRFLVEESQVTLFAFVIMINHFHLIWQMPGGRQLEDIQRNFLRFTSKKILKNLGDTKPNLLSELVVDKKDRKRQVWERNSLSIPLWSDKVFEQKLDYIHMNPVNAGLCKLPEDYKYSSARFYEVNEDDWGFITHYQG